MTLRQQKAFSNIILHCSLTLSITKMQKRVAYWRLIDLASLSMSISVGIVPHNKVMPMLNIT